MVNTITVAWATPVSAVDLGAWMEAYGESKASITVFKLCIKYTSAGSPLSHLPPEICKTIIASIRQSIFIRRRKEWAAAVLCCSRDCNTIDHIDHDEYKRLRKDFFDNRGEDGSMGGRMEDEMSNGSGDFEDYEFENNLYANEIGLKEHETIVDNFLPKIVYNPRSNDLYTKFASHKKSFADAFGLEAYFSTSEFYDEDGDTEIEILAYLILPSKFARIDPSAGPDFVSFQSSMIIDPHIIKQPSPRQKNLFTSAMSSMQIQPVVSINQLTVAYKTSDLYNLGREIKRVGEGDEDGLERGSRREEVGGRAEKLAATDWPRLMVLASGRHPSDRRY